MFSSENNKQNNIDWAIQVITGNRKTVPDDPGCVLDCVTCGLKKYGHGEINLVGSRKNVRQIRDLINAVGVEIAKGGQSPADVVKRAAAKTGIDFRMVQGVYNGRKFLLLVPDFEPYGIRLPERLFRDLTDYYPGDPLDYNLIILDDDLPVTLNGIACRATRSGGDYYTLKTASCAGGIITSSYCDDLG